MTNKRKGRIYVDFLQNRPKATLAAPYSVRPKPGATVDVVALMILGVAFGGVHLPALIALKLFGTLVAGSIPFCAAFQARILFREASAAADGLAYL